MHGNEERLSLCHKLRPQGPALGPLNRFHIIGLHASGAPLSWVIRALVIFKNTQCDTTKKGSRNDCMFKF
jgi:hypothetical protein